MGLRANSVGATIVRVVDHRFIYDRTLGCQGLHPSHNNGEVTMVSDLGNILSENMLYSTTSVITSVQVTASDGTFKCYSFFSVFSTSSAKECYSLK